MTEQNQEKDGDLERRARELARKIQEVSDEAARQDLQMQIDELKAEGNELKQNYETRIQELEQEINQLRSQGYTPIEHFATGPGIKSPYYQEYPYNRIAEIIVEQLGIDCAAIKPKSYFIDDLGADSLDTVELVMAFEEEFRLEIPDEDAEKLITVQKAMEYITNAIRK